MNDRNVRPRAVILAVALAWGLPAPARVLIVPKHGASIWAQTAAKEGGTLTYITENGEEKVIAVADLLQVVPSVSRGKRYSPEAVQKVIGAIEKLRVARPKLRKQVQPLYDEWQALNRPDPELPVKIDALIARFNASDKNTVVYRDVAAGLGMLKYHDMQGRFTDRIDAAVRTIKAAYFQTNIQRLTALVEEGKTDISHFARLRQLAEDMLGTDLPSADAQRTRELLRRANGVVYAANMKRAAVVFAGGRQIDGYLAGRTLLLDMRKHVAIDDRQRAVVDKKLAIVREQTARTHPQLGFKLKGYPLTHDDYRLLQRAGDRWSGVGLAHVETDERILLVPERTPPEWRPGQAVHVAFRLILNRTLPADGAYAFCVAVFDDFGELKPYIVEVPAPKAVKGRAKAVLRDKLQRLDRDVVAAKRHAGRPFNVYVYLARLPPGAAGREPEHWVALSLACAFPARAP